MCCASINGINNILENTDVLVIEANTPATKSKETENFDKNDKSIEDNVLLEKDL